MVARHNEGVARDERDCARCARCTVQVSAPAQALPSFQIAMRRCGVLPFLAPRFVVSSRSQESLPSQPCTSRRPLCASVRRPFIHAIPLDQRINHPQPRKKKEEERAEYLESTLCITCAHHRTPNCDPIRQIPIRHITLVNNVNIPHRAGWGQQRRSDAAFWCVCTLTDRPAD